MKGPRSTSNHHKNKVFNCTFELDLTAKATLGGVFSAAVKAEEVGTKTRIRGLTTKRFVGAGEAAVAPMLPMLLPTNFTVRTPSK